AIETREITLTNGTSTTLTFTWNTSGFAKGNYTIWAYAWPVPGETDTADNNYINGIVTVTIPGDINGDFKCEGKDNALVAKAYDTQPGNQRWIANADINNDNRVEGKDVAIIAKYYGTQDP
ncbi:MAG: dockerin type I domain-containing protein, partial [Candidatus Bathyarchaeales archaeon]